MSDLSQGLRKLIEIQELLDIPLKNGTIGLTIETILKIADKLDQYEEFLETIQDACGPYPDLNGHQIVADVRKIS